MKYGRIHRDVAIKGAVCVCLLAGVRWSWAKSMATAPATRSAAPKVDMAFVPQSVQLNHSLSFDANGRPQAERTNLSISLRGQYKGDKTLVGYQPEAISRLEDAAGRVYPVNVYSGMNRFNSRQQQRYIGFGFNVQSPEGIQSIKQVQGRVRLLLADGPLREAALAPLEKYLGKRVRIAELGKEVWVEIARNADNPNLPQKGVKITFSTGAYERFNQAEFESRSGIGIPANGWGGGTQNGVHHRTYNLEIPDDGRVLLRFWQNVESVTVPFTVTDIPMPGTKQSSPVTEVTVHAKPILHLSPEDAAGLNRLKLRIER